MTIKEISEMFDLSQDTLRYYEKEGIIPKVNRVNGIRNYTERDLGWIRNAKCMRMAGLSVNVLKEYIKLYFKGDSTIEARRDLLASQREKLLEDRKKIDETLELLEYKISRYDTAVKTGVLSWEDDKRGEN